MLLRMKNCPNCGAVIEPYKCKCEYCGTWYFDFTAFDMTEDVPYYVKFRTPYGIITTLAKPELNEINIWSDSVYAMDNFGNKLCSFVRNNNCDLAVVFHTYQNPETGSLYEIQTEG